MYIVLNLCFINLLIEAEDVAFSSELGAVETCEKLRFLNTHFY